MAFLPEPKEKIGDVESVSGLYELTGSEDDRFKAIIQSLKKTIWFYS